MTAPILIALILSLMAIIINSNYRGEKVQDTQNHYDCSQGCEECKKRFWEAKEK